MRLGEQVEDARYSIKAWSKDVPWSAVFAGLGVTITGFARKDAGIFATGFVAVVVGLFPKVRPKVAYEVAKTWAMRKKWMPIPPDEKPLITREIVIGPKGMKDQ